MLRQRIHFSKVSESFICFKLHTLTSGIELIRNIICIIKIKQKRKYFITKKVTLQKSLQMMVLNAFLKSLAKRA
jgi:hypothetical protein